MHRVFVWYCVHDVCIPTFIKNLTVLPKTSPYLSWLNIMKSLGNTSLFRIVAELELNKGSDSHLLPCQSSLDKKIPAVYIQQLHYIHACSICISYRILSVTSE